MVCSRGALELFTEKQCHCYSGKSTPHCKKFQVELPSTKETVPRKTADGVLCGLTSDGEIASGRRQTS